MPDISLRQLRSELSSGAPPVLVEALPAEYYRKEHLPHAINLPYGRVAELAPSLLPDKSKPVVVYCMNPT